jgi:hypothetical protein
MDHHANDYDRYHAGPDHDPPGVEPWHTDPRPDPMHDPIYPDDPPDVDEPADRWTAGAALRARALTTRDRRIVAEVLDRLVQRDIDRRGIRDTYRPELLTLDASTLSEFAAAMRLDYDGDDVDLAHAAADSVVCERDGCLELSEDATARRLGRDGAP